MAKYIDDSDFFYEIVLSKGRGKLTKKAERMIISKNSLFILIFLNQV